MDWEKELGDIMGDLPEQPHDPTVMGMTLPTALEQAARLQRACPWLEVAVIGQGADFLYRLVACTVKGRKRKLHGPIYLTGGRILTVMYHLWNPVQVDTLIANSAMPAGLFEPPTVEPGEPGGAP